MNLLQIRTAFVRKSGRYDLVASETIDGLLHADYDTDNGADDYIHKAIDFLDARIRTSRQRVVHTYALAESDLGVAWDSRSSVESVTLNGSDLKQIDIKEWIWLYYGGEIPPSYGIDNDPSVVDGLPPNPGRPRWWAFNAEVLPAEADLYETFDDYNILLHPACDQDYTLDVIGWDRTDGLTENTDSNRWTEKEPYLVIDAALMMLAEEIQDDKSSMYEARVEKTIKTIISRSIRDEVEAIGSNHIFG